MHREAEGGAPACTELKFDNMTKVHLQEDQECFDLFHFDVEETEINRQVHYG